jgi:hypothetical protein
MPSCCAVVPFEWIEFDRKALPAPPVWEMPSPLLKAMRLPAPADVPPAVLLAAPLLMRMPLEAFEMATVPAASVPMRLPCTVLPVALEPLIRMPALPLPEMRLPPTVLLGEPETSTPCCVLDRAAVPAASVPM